jgi:hypothetical protein
LRDEGVVVMGIQREGVGYIGAPSPDEIVRPGDTLVLYATVQRISELDRRKRGKDGDTAHDEACLGREEDSVLGQIRQGVDDPGKVTQQGQEPRDTRLAREQPALQADRQAREKQR